MSETPKDLLARANQHTPSDPAVRECWDFIVRGIEVGWLDDDELRELLAHLRAGRDFGVEELLFAHIGDELRISFLDDRAVCSPAAMIEALAAMQLVDAQ